MRYDRTGPADITFRAHGSVQRQEPDLVFDFAGNPSPDIGALAFMLTAREMARADDRRVWLRALSDHSWQVLHAMGLDDLFELFPNGEHTQS